jgi:sigma-B regulation protein RsbU (phosphoserine phosphatase)
VHISFPGHGGYPAEYDPRQRPWYVDATDEIRWTLPMVDASTGQVVMTASKQLRYPDGSRAGVAAMDVLLTEVLRIEALRPVTTAMRSFLVTPSSIRDAPPSAHCGAEGPSDSADSRQIDRPGAAHGRRSADGVTVKELGSGRSGYLEMPYKGIASIWAFAPIEAGVSFVIVVPREVTDRLPEKTVAVIQSFTTEKLLIMAVAALGAILLAIVAALAGSRAFTRPMYELVDVAARLSRGDFSVRVRTRTGDERDQVIQAFNDMVPKLEDQLRMRESLQLATEVQQNLLPRHEPSLPGLDIAGISLYCDETGGDYYDFLRVSRDSAGPAAVVVGDVSGHGPPLCDGLGPGGVAAAGVAARKPR